MLRSKSRWIIRPYNQTLAKKLVDELSISPMVARLLVHRGIKTVDEARQFFTADFSNFHDPFLLDSMDVAIERIEIAIRNHEKILIFGDYDADGVTSTTVMLHALKEKGADVDFYIPNRFTEGYGPNEAAFRWAKNERYSLIITVDTGISALSEMKIAQQLGLDVIITDHHEPSFELPEAYAIIHPKKPGSRYPFKELAGVGVALKVAHALLGRLPKHLLQFAAIGTIADLVPLTDENRLIAHLGIKAIQSTTNPGLCALLKVAAIEKEDVNEDTIGFSIGPRINALGRLTSADPAVQLLMTESVEEAKAIAEEIDQINRDRQQLVNEMTEEAMKEVEQSFELENDRVLVVAKEGWNAGVIGIVASRLVEAYYRPTIVFSIDGKSGEAKGSARSIAGFDLFQNLSKNRDILPHFGGHTMAAGMTVKVEHIPVLRERLNRQAAELLTSEDLIPITNVDVSCSLQEVNLKTVEEMMALAPFGEGNAKPHIMISDVSLKQIKKIGHQQNHLKATFEKEGHTLEVVGFGLGHLVDHISPFSQIKAVGHLSINEWNGYRKPQFILKDVAVEEWQLFDWRAKKEFEKHIDLFLQGEYAMIAFRKQTVQALHLEKFDHEITLIDDETVFSKLIGRAKSIALLDLPYDIRLLKNFIQKLKPERIYAVFNHEEEHFFHTLPTREHFKWYYGFLYKQQPFHIEKYADALSRKKGWSKATIQFMTQVFLELEFVKIDNGFITLVENPTKRTFESSKTYHRKQELLQMESELIYSSYQSLKQWFDKMMKASCELEEETVR